MNNKNFSVNSVIEAPVESVFAYHEQEGVLDRLTPPWEQVRIVERHGTIKNGDRTTLEIHENGIPLQWVAEHHSYQAPVCFCDKQVSGPFQSWNHAHRFSALEPRKCALTDEIDYTLPLGALGEFFGDSYTRKKLTRLFRYRHVITRSDTVLKKSFPYFEKQKILVTGGSGLIGKNLVALLRALGHSVFTVTRNPKHTSTRSFLWNPETNEIVFPADQYFDAVVHLAGEPVGNGRWSAGTKTRIKQSRVQGTESLIRALQKLPIKPKTFVSASAVGLYGSKGDAELTEYSADGTGFLAEVTRAWETASSQAKTLEARVVQLRFGVVIAGNGGALKKLLPPFQCGAGGKIGDGKQWMSWVAIDDVLRVIYSALADTKFDGPINVTSPTPVTNEEFTTTLGKVLNRPTFIPVPASALQFVFGEMADETILASQRCIPTKLLEAGFLYSYPKLEDALRHVLGRY